MTAQQNFVELAKWLQARPGTIASSGDEAVAQMSDRFRPHLIDGSRSALENLDFKHYEKSFDGMSINYLQYGPEVSIDAGDFETFYMLEFPISGGVDIQFNGEIISSNSEKAILLSPGHPIRSTWKCNTQQIMLKFEKIRLQKSIEKRFGRRSEYGHLVFDPHIASEGLQITRISELLRILASEETASNKNSSYNPSPLLDAICDTLIGDVELYTATASSPLSSACRPGHLSRFLSLLDDPEMLLRPLSELASQVGTTDRTLRNSARRFLNMSPHELIVRKRLERARQMLSHSDLPIGQVAARSGYSNAGRFARAYRDLFGHLPSRTDAHHG